MPKRYNNSNILSKFDRVYFKDSFTEDIFKITS